MRAVLRDELTFKVRERATSGSRQRNGENSDYARRDRHHDAVVHLDEVPDDVGDVVAGALFEAVVLGGFAYLISNRERSDKR